jgi:hypothetical protein
LTPVGDCFFVPEPFCRKVKTTVRFLTVENMSGPYRTYNMFPVADRLAILRKFLMRYTWGPGDDVSRCLDVYENLAANMYGNELSESQFKCMEKYGEDKEEWKKHPPCWCKNLSHWIGLCDIWARKNLDEVSSTNRENMAGWGIGHHVGVSRDIGKTSRVSKGTSQVEAKPCPSRSTATFGQTPPLYTQEEVDGIVAEKLAAHEEHYRAQLEELRRNDEYNKACVEQLLLATRTNPPPLNVMWYSNS